MSVIDLLKPLFAYKPRQPKQTTFCYCSCGNELCSSGSFVSDTYDERGRNDVHYRCSQCGREHHFDFDAPVPLRREGGQDE